MMHFAPKRIHTALLAALLAAMGAIGPTMAQHHDQHAARHEAPAAGAHQHGHYADMVDREIKALSAQQIEDLQQGRGMGMSLPAELNQTPGPLHLLEMREALGLSDAQAAQVQSIIDAMKKEAQALGEAIIDAERLLDQSFKQRKANMKAVDRYTAEIGILTGKLRAVHLKAHLKASALLTPDQIAQYDRRRGYVKGVSAQQSPSPHAH